VTVSTDRGGITLPVAIADLPPQVVWLPTNSPGSTLRRSLGVTSGAVVRLTAGNPGPILAVSPDGGSAASQGENLAASPGGSAALPGENRWKGANQ